MTARLKPPVVLQELWRPAPDFIGPLLPPMLLWFARGCPKDQWELDALACAAATGPRLQGEFRRLP
jgi:hypothetical protein